MAQRYISTLDTYPTGCCNAVDDESMTTCSQEIGSDQPHCIDPAMAQDVINETTRRHRGRRRSEAADAHHHPNQPHHRPHGKFKREDIVELYDPDSSSVQVWILPP